LPAKHVFMDKPLALTLPRERSSSSWRGSATCRFMLCHNLLFHSAVIEAGAVRERGGIGRVTTADSWSSGWLDLMPWTSAVAREDGRGSVVRQRAAPALRPAGLARPITEYVRSLRGARAGSAVRTPVSQCPPCGRAGATTRISYADRLPGRPGRPAVDTRLRGAGTADTSAADVVPHPTVTIVRRHRVPARESHRHSLRSAFRRGDRGVRRRGPHAPRSERHGEDSLQILS
jgi:hypothetical protein